MMTSYLKLSDIRANLDTIYVCINLLTFSPRNYCALVVCRSRGTVLKWADMANIYTIYKFISDKWNLISDSCNWISDACNWISDSCNWISDYCNWISDSCNWISVLCNIISDKWNLISANEIEFQNHYLPITFQRENLMCIFWTYFRALLVVSAIYTCKLIYFCANEIELSFAKITGFN